MVGVHLESVLIAALLMGWGVEEVRGLGGWEEGSGRSPAQTSNRIFEVVKVGFLLVSLLNQPQEGPPTRKSSLQAFHRENLTFGESWVGPFCF